MSRENVELHERFIGAFRRGDWDVIANDADADILVRTDDRWPEQRIYGREAWLAFLRGVAEARGTDIRFEEVLDLGDRVLARTRWSIHGQHSGISGEFRYSVVTTYRGGRSIFIEFFLDHELALQALEMS